MSEQPANPRAASVRAIYQTDADLRWGFVFLDADGGRLASLYANEAVTVGLLDNDRCEFGVELHDILQNSFAKLFD